MAAPPPLPAPSASVFQAPNTTPGAQTASAQVPVVPFPNSTQTSMPAAPVPESVILGEATTQGQPTTPLSLFDDDDEPLEPDSYSSSEEELISEESTENFESSILSQSNESIDLFESNESVESLDSIESVESVESAESIESAGSEESLAILDSGEEGQEIVEYDQVESEFQSYPDSGDEMNAEQFQNQQYDQVEGGFEEQESYDTNYQDYATESAVLDGGEQEVGEQEAGGYEQYETDQSYQMSGEVNGFAANIEDPLDSPEALNQIMEQSQRVVRDGCFQILNELDQVLDSLRAAAQVAMHNDNIQAVTDIMQHSKQIKALRERLVSFKEENIKDEE